MFKGLHVATTSSQALQTQAHKACKGEVAGMAEGGSNPQSPIIYRTKNKRME